MASFVAANFVLKLKHLEARVTEAKEYIEQEKYKDDLTQLDLVRNFLAGALQQIQMLLPAREKDEIRGVDYTSVPDIIVKAEDSLIELDTRAKKLQQARSQPSSHAEQITSPPLKVPRVEETEQLDLNSRPRTLAFKRKLRDFLSSCAYANPEQLITEAVEEFAVLEADYITLADGVGLLMLRNRIDSLETKFMIGKLQAEEIKKALGLNEQDIQFIVQGIMTKVKQTDLASGAVNQVVASEIVKFHHSNIVAGSQAQMNDPHLSDDVYIKASIHYLRWKYAFKFPRHPTVKKMKKFIEQSEIDEDVMCIEIAHLYVALSTLGVHLKVMPNVGLGSILRSLKLYSLNEKPTIITVKSLYCDIFEDDL